MVVSGHMDGVVRVRTHATMNSINTLSSMNGITTINIMTIIDSINNGAVGVHQHVRYV